MLHSPRGAALRGGSVPARTASPHAQPTCPTQAQKAGAAARLGSCVVCAKKQEAGLVYACELPTALAVQEDTVYACKLPERSAAPPRWQFWRRARPAEAPVPSRSEEERSRERLQGWEETRARLLVVAEAYRTAELAKQCGDFETAARLRDRARTWALAEGTPAGGAAALGAVLSDLSSGRAPEMTRVVRVEIRQLPGGVREVWALVDVQAPSEFVWRTLTDYERLADIVPSLDENRILERWTGGVRLQQVAAQELALGLKFSATATLDIEELPNGIVPTARGTSASERRIVPRSAGGPPRVVRDICFTLVESRDLRRFSGTWRIETVDTLHSRLIYAVEVQPMPWLPVGLIAERVGADLRGNLAAVRDHAEELATCAVPVQAR